MKKYTIKGILCALLMMNISCQDHFLEAIPDRALLVPSKVSDFRALMDNYDVMINAPHMGIVGCDDIYTTDAGWESEYYEIDKRAYLWEKDIYLGQVSTDWNAMYQQILYANIVLDGLAKIKPDNSNLTEYQTVKGTALFHRALAYYHLAQLFAKPYQSSTANLERGVPVRLSSDINEIKGRGTLQQTYDQIISDLKAAQEMLSTESAVKTRPTKQAAFGLLARVCQTMQNYSDAITYASECLKISNTLLDFNQLVATATRPVPSPLSKVNDEVVFYTGVSGIAFLESVLTMIDPALYASYHDDDLRKVIFFRDRGNGAITFKGNYSGNIVLFAGIATDEVYLIRAESYARIGNTLAAMADLNTLMVKRWNNKVPFPKFTAAGPDEALSLILEERRKELVYRNLRWTDLRRLNLEPKFAKAIKRTINGTEYVLEPNDGRYVFAIPDDEIKISGIEQNMR